MGLFGRWKRGKRRRRAEPVEGVPPAPESEEAVEAEVEPGVAPPPRIMPTEAELEDLRELVEADGRGPAVGPEPPLREREPRSRDEALRRGISGWVEERAHRVVRRAYESHAGDLEERARRVMSSMYERTADDLEERAVRAMRRALESEAQRIKDAIEHSIEVKKREVRLSLIVLVVSALVYLLLYWFTNGPSS